MGCTTSKTTTGSAVSDSLAAATNAAKTTTTSAKSQPEQPLQKEEVQKQKTTKAVIAKPASEASSSISSKLALGAGCYWGTEKYVYKDFQKKFPGSIKRTEVGFMSPLDKPRIANPTYRQVCTGTSGHVEVLYVELNNPAEHFEELCRFFFTFHDPTLKDRQGNDRGFQYSSWIFCDDEEQLEIAKRVKQELQGAIDVGAIGNKIFESKTVETQICDLKEFTKAEEEHQMYLFNNPNGYCNHRIRLKQWYTQQ